MARGGDLFRPKYLRSLRPIPGEEPGLWDRLFGYQPVEDGEELALLLSQSDAFPVALGMLRHERFEIRRSAISVLYGMKPLPREAAAGPGREMTMASGNRRRTCCNASTPAPLSS
jgi:hypothetical protein